MEESLKNRKKKKYICPNPLFEKWIIEWKESAESKGLKSRYNYSKALTSLRKYPLPLSSGKEAKILEHFGDKICAMLDEKLLEWKQLHNITSISNSSNIKQMASNSTSSMQSLSNGLPNKSAPKKRAQGIANTSSSVTSSIPNSLPFKVTPKKPTSTIHNKKATKITTHSSKQIIPVSEIEEENSIYPEEFYLLPEDYEIILCVDNAETNTGNSKNKKQMLAELEKCNIKYDIRKLHVGDFIWVARDNTNMNHELVLNFIVERKRLDDLGKSIKDGRFREQKFRLKSCGLKQPIYLVEYHSEAKYCGIPESTLEQAIVNTQIIDGFIVKRTQNVKESITYLSLMTKHLKEKFKGQILKSAARRKLLNNNCSPYAFMDFKEFNSTSVKNKKLTVQEMFAKHLLQFFGLSVERASAIVEQFQTPAKLFKGYDDCLTYQDKLQMISSIRFGKFLKNIGPALSKSVFQVYCTKGPLH